jgi:hypothetical protein
MDTISCLKYMCLELYLRNQNRRPLHCFGQLFAEHRFYSVDVFYANVLLNLVPVFPNAALMSFFDKGFRLENPYRRKRRLLKSAMQEISACLTMMHETYFTVLSSSAHLEFSLFISSSCRLFCSPYTIDQGTRSLISYIEPIKSHVFI